MTELDRREHLGDRRTADRRTVADERFVSSRRRRDAIAGTLEVLTGDPGLRHLTPDELDHLSRRIVQAQAERGIPV